MKTFYWRKALTVLPVLAAMAGGQTVWDGLTGVDAWDTLWFTKSASSASFKISAASQLAGLAQLVNTGRNMSGKTITLTGDIALNATDQQGWQISANANEWVAIGTPSRPFQGTFEGGGFTVRGVYIVDSAKSTGDYVGLFGYVNNNGKIKKLRVAESRVVGRSYVGGLVGSASDSISDCYSTATVVGTGDYVGGLAGYMSVRGAITNSYATGNVSGRSYVGGLVGAGVRDTIRGGYATGEVTGSGDYVGGLIGSSSGGYIINSYATGTVTAADGSYVGGLAGSSDTMVVTSGTTRTVYPANIVNCYASGNVIGDRYAGGLVGRKTGGAIRNSYAAGEVSAKEIETGGGLLGVAAGNPTITYGYYAADAGIVPVVCDDDDDDCSAANVLEPRGLGIPKAGEYMKSEEFVSLLNVAAYALKNNSLKENTNKWYSLPGQFPKLSIDSVTTAVFNSCFAGGDGTKDRPFLIDTVQRLENLAVYVNCGATSSGKFFKLSNDIFVADTANWKNWNDKTEWPRDKYGNKAEWTPIGQQPSDTAGQPKVRFNGTFDGGGFAVYGVYINKSADSSFSGMYQGLFGRVEREGTQGGDIKNVGMACSYINGYCYVGGLAGWNKKGSVTRSYIKNANIEAWGGRNGAGGIGGLVGLNDSAGLVINSYASANIFGEINMAGGLVGWNSANSRISYSYASGKVDITGDDAGGLVGRNDGSAIRDSYAVGEVLAAGDASGKGGNVIGGLVGMNFNATVIKCYALGTVSGNSSVGGLVGSRLSNGKVDSSYYRADTATIKNDYGVPVADSLMQGDTAVYKGWDFKNVWAIDEESRSYPYLGMRRAVKPYNIAITPESGTVKVDERLVISVSATVPAGDTISYQWFSNAADTNANGVKISGATGREFTVPTGADALIYYYAVVTNTTAAAPDSVAGSRTADAASKTAKIVVGNGPGAAQSSDRVIPGADSGKETAAISPAAAVTAGLTAGPSPAGKSRGALNFYRSGKRVSNASLYVFDASGNAVKRIEIADSASSSRPNRKVGEWDLTNKKGVPVPDGTYLVRGVITIDGKREKVSVPVGVSR